MKNRFFTLIQILSIFCVFGLGFVTIVATGADDLADALGVDRTVDVDETIEVSLPAITVDGTAPAAGALPMRMVADVIDETNCTNTETTVQALVNGINWGEVIPDAVDAGFTLDTVTSFVLSEVSIDYTVTWDPVAAAAPTSLTCSFTLTGVGTLGNVAIPDFDLTVASGTIAYTDLGITNDDLTTMASYFWPLANWSEGFTYCATCGYDPDLWDVDSYTVALEFVAEGDIVGTGTISFD